MFSLFLKIVEGSLHAFQKIFEKLRKSRCAIFLLNFNLKLHPFKQKKPNLNSLN